ncbi:MAG TPA: hypothetical protein VD963_04385 [Phycisphaerales bacterium]|nr:hypothetical protein [Phycisphaerales bacterium]
MTTVQSMRRARGPDCRRARAPVALALGILATLQAPGCARRGPELVRPDVLVSPYPSERVVLWAVAPLANESGTSAAAELAVSDALVAAVTEVEGLAGVPVNRVLAAMQRLGLSALSGPGDARRLAEALGVDALVVGSITAYDPYDPPKLGLVLAVYAREGGVIAAPERSVDPGTLRGSPRDTATATTRFPDRPASLVSLHHDGANHDIRARVRAYAHGRHEPGSARGWERYLASMDLYTRFVAHDAVRLLLEEERRRLGGPGPLAAREHPSP